MARSLRFSSSHTLNMFGRTCSCDKLSGPLLFFPHSLVDGSQLLSSPRSGSAFPHAFVFICSIGMLLFTSMMLLPADLLALLVSSFSALFRCLLLNLFCLADFEQLPAVGCARDPLVPPSTRSVSFHRALT